jgi:hypothetical protein
MKNPTPTVFRMSALGLSFHFLLLNLSGCAFLGDFSQGLFSDENSATSESSPLRNGRMSSKLAALKKDTTRHSNSAESLNRLQEESNVGADSNIATKEQEPLASASISELSGVAGKDSSTSSTALPTSLNGNSSITGLEVTWKIPESPAEGFVLYFGSTPSRLDSHVRVASDELETFPDPDAGALYRYIIPDVPPDGPLFVALSSYTGAEEGPRSEPVEVRKPASPDQGN